MTRSTFTLAVAAVFIFACDSQPVAPRRATENSSLRLARVVAEVTPNSNIVSFETMYGVDEAFINSKEIRNVRGDELPWEVGSATGSLTVGGHLQITVRGLVFSDDPEVPPELRGKNDETEFRGLVSCLVSERPGKNHDKGKAKVETVNILTAGFPATPSGDSDIDTTVDLPDDCVAPIIFVMSGSENKWFAVTGAETSG